MLSRLLPLASLAVLSLVTAACAGDDPTTPSSGTTTTTTPVDLPPPLDPLPPAQATDASDRFATGGYCAQCHYAGDAPVLRNAAGDDISPVKLWRSSMMAFAARDPYYLAVFSEELHALPGAAADVERTCTRCHAPAGSLEREQQGGHLGFADLTSGDGPEAHLGRDGVTCSLCHQIQDIALGQVASFSGGFQVGYDRLMYGPHEDPDEQPMEFFLGYTPTPSDHVLQSELCATCHTVVTPILDEQGAPTGGDFLEQAPYLEWLNSDYRDDAPCRVCHLAASDADGSAIVSPISKFPDGLPARQPYGQHVFVGGNSYLLGLMADNIAWTGSDVAPAELDEAAARSEEHLRGAAELTVLEAAPEGGALRVVVEVRNRTGHKLPTGYPSRRAWLHFRAEDAAGAALFESGAHDATGAIVDPEGRRLDADGAVAPHLDEITAPDQVQIYEAVAADITGAPTHRALNAAYYLKDNRLLPAGWSSSHEWIDWIAPAGVDADPSFGPATDRVTYRVPTASAVRRVRVELLYQSVTPAALDHLAVVPTPAAVAFSDMARARPPAPVVIASAVLDL